MKILYDYQIFSFQEYGGISRYFYELIKGMEKLGNEVFIDGRFSNNIFLPKLKGGVKKFLPDYKLPYKNILLFYLNRFLDGERLKKGNFDIFHPTYYHPYFLPLLKGRPYVVTVFDMTHELFPDKCGGFIKKTLEYKRKVVLGANKIIAISESTKNDLIRLYGLSKSKIEVIYLGNPLEGVRPLKVPSLPANYILYVGNRSGYKNFLFFVESISTILIREKDLFLVCAGGGDFSSQESKLFSKLGILGKVKQVSFKSDRELAYIYKKAKVYVLPSLYEGFGLTVLEAFSMGCPVIASNRSSIPEVCGKAAVYVNPEDRESIKIAVEKVLSDEDVRNHIVYLGFLTLKRFSWAKTVTETLNVYKSLC